MIWEEIKILNFVDVVRHWKSNYLRWRHSNQDVVNASESLLRFREFSQLLESFFRDWIGNNQYSLNFERREHQEPHIHARYSLKIGGHLLVLTYTDAYNHDSLYCEPRQRLILLSPTKNGDFEEVANLDLPDNLGLFDPATKGGIHALEGFFYLIQSIIQENRGLEDSLYPHNARRINVVKHRHAVIDFVDFFTEYMFRMSWFLHPMDFDRKSWRISEPELLAGYEDYRLGVYLKASLADSVADPTVVITNSWEQPMSSGQPKFRKIRCLSLPLDFRALENLDSRSGLVYLRINQLVHVMLYDLLSEEMEQVWY